MTLLSEAPPLGGGESHAIGIFLMSDARPRIGISACLLGRQVRYDGGHRHDPYLTDTLGPHLEFVPVCPEVEAGMGVPRETIRLAGDPAAPRLVGAHSGRDWTDRMLEAARKRVATLQAKDLCGCILKKGSPSCGMERVRVYGKGGMPRRDGRGLYAQVLMREMPLLPVEEEGRLHDPVLRENYVERIFAFRRWKDLLASRPTRGALVDFQARHKYLMLAHSEPHLRRLGRIVAGAKGRPFAGVLDEAGRVFMEGLAVHATAKRNANVLQHAAGYFSESITPGDRAELQEAIDAHRRGIAPLVVPLALVRHHARTCRVKYLLDQVFFQPHPKELMLRNHV
jgi:uncharacterized protein YbbK (DUF523 family)/uncharacterized protein YbgA (DUF1722 family)